MGSSGGTQQEGEPPPVSAIRLAAPSLLLMLPGSVVDVPVTWSSPLSSADYQTAVDASALIGKGSAAVTSQTAAGITLHVSATSLVAVGTQVLCAGWTS